MHGAAELGAELFVMDAGWYVGAGRDGVFDFTSGLGSWEVDEARFPEGVKALTDYAHEPRVEVRHLGRARARGAVDGGAVRARAGSVARDGRRQVRIGGGRPDLPGERGGAAVGARRR